MHDIVPFEPDSTCTLLTAAWPCPQAGLLMEGEGKEGLVYTARACVNFSVRMSVKALFPTWHVLTSELVHGSKEYRPLH